MWKKMRFLEVVPGAQKEQKCIKHGFLEVATGSGRVRPGPTGTSRGNGVATGGGKGGGLK